MPDSDGYPLDSELEELKTWDFRDTPGAFEFMHRLWWNQSWGWQTITDRDGTDFHLVSTGGWSGNESLVYALEQNIIIWSQTWRQTRAGGHYTFEVKPWIRK